MTGIHTYSTTASENVQANTGINWDEGMAPSAVNNSARQNMADIRGRWNDAAWFQYGIGSKSVAATYASSTSITLAGGDATAAWHAGRRVKATGTSTGTIYGQVSSSSYNSGTTTTTVNFAWDSGSLSNETLTVYLAAASPVTGTPIAPGSVASLLGILGKLINGLTLSTAGSSSTFSVATGYATDSTAAAILDLSSSISKTTGSWAVGTATGSLDTGTIANSTWYHVYLIQRSDTGVVDVLISLSASAPTMPTNYDRKRRIGAMKTDSSGNWTAFTQVGDEFLWSSMPIDQSVASLGTSAANYAVSVPGGVKVQALLNVGGSSGSGTLNYMCVSSPDQTLITPGASNSNLGWTSGTTIGTAFVMARTNTSSQVAAVAGLASSQISISTRGWIDPRGKF